MGDMSGEIRDGDVRDIDLPGTGAARRTGYGEPATAERVTAEGAAWLESSSPFPLRVRALWAARPAAPVVLPCGRAFDVVNLPVLFGRRTLDRLWSPGPGCGPVAVHRGRMLVFAVPGTAARLPSLLSWEEWASRVPPMLCHGVGDAVTVPPLLPTRPDGGSWWLVAPGARDPWLPDAAVLLWACLRAARPRAGAEPAAGVRPED